MAGELITCPDCQGWSAIETGYVCFLCQDEGVIWNEFEDEDADEDYAVCVSNHGEV